MKTFFIFVIIFFCSITMANASGIILITPPTKCSNGTPIPTGTCGAIGGYNAYCSTVTPTISGKGVLSKNAGNVKTFDIVGSGLVKASGKWFCGITCYNLKGLQSILSNIVSFSCTLERSGRYNAASHEVTCNPAN